MGENYNFGAAENEYRIEKRMESSLRPGLSQHNSLVNYMK